MKRNKNFCVEKKWIFRDKGPSYSIEGIRPEITGILSSRGIGEKEASDFLYPDYLKLTDPYKLSGMKEAVATIKGAVRDGEKIVIYGDYDVDGVSATALLVKFFTLIGADVSYYIPSREDEGYGLNKKAVEKIAHDGAKLIITVDCGTNAEDEINLAHNLGVKVVVTDHHQKKPTKVQPEALVNPSGEKGAHRDLAGAGVAFYLVRALQPHYPEQLPEGREKWLLDLVALGTICDVVSLTGDNRILANFGLKVMAKSRNQGIRALASQSGFSLDGVDGYKVGFLLGPRLNAAGRIKSAQNSLSLLLTENPDEATVLAHELSELNAERQKLTEKIIEEAKGVIAGLDGDRKIFLVKDKNWPAGVVGIAASRLVEEYGRPVLIMQEKGEELKGSARSIKGFDIIKALNECRECFTQFGGHSQAAGFSLAKDRFIVLDQKLISIAGKKIKEEDLTPEIVIDYQLEAESVSRELVDQLALLEPFGTDNYKPVFSLSGAEVSKYQLVGNPKVHLKVTLEKDGQTFGAIAFNYGQSVDFSPNEKIDVAFTLEMNEWQGQKTVDLHIIDIMRTKK